jgi:hypothetical protein
MELLFAIHHRVIMVRIFKKWSEMKNFSFFKILVFMECRAHSQVQQEQQEQRGSQCGFPSYHTKDDLSSYGWIL